MPIPLPYRYSVREAIPWIAQVSTVHYSSDVKERHTFHDAGQTPAPTVKQSMGSNGEWSSEALVTEDPDTGEEIGIADTAIGEEWDRLSVEESSDRYFNLRRVALEGPSSTVTQMGGVIGAASVTHPTEKRKFTIPELKRICSFPDDFQLTGTYKQRWERLGRAVPPVMMSHVAREVLGILQEAK